MWLEWTPSELLVMAAEYLLESEHQNTKDLDQPI